MSICFSLFQLAEHIELDNKEKRTRTGNVIYKYENKQTNTISSGDHRVQLIGKTSEINRQ